MQNIVDKVEVSGLSNIDDMLKMAGKLHSEVLEQKINIDDIHKNYRDFSLAYPIIYKMITEHRDYDRKAFRKFLKHIAERNKKHGNFWKDAKDFAQSHELYLLSMYKNKKPKPTKKQIFLYKKELNDTIKKEWDKMDAAAKTLEKTTNEQIHLEQLKKGILELIKLDDAALMRLQEPNIEAALGWIPSECK